MDTDPDGLGDWGNMSNETTPAQAKRPYRIRTPPPLAPSQALHTDCAPIEETPGSNGPLVDGSSSPEPLLAETTLSTSQDGPTVAEFTAKRAKEIRSILDGRKSKPTGKEDWGKGPKPIGDYSSEEQGVMHVMRVSIQHTFMALAPWMPDDELVIERAKDFARKHTRCNIPGIVTDGFIKTVCLLLSCKYGFLSNLL
jgi:hypothetical protein